ncbi:hypothetical protein T265_02602 [Opisthorchis viverrini]|uniref:Uncharacterized protein n=1 Tax=Opisthorchis viverrini TaxID=6198 RepID=A0A074ZYG8_OPIVI|nr:hypothetical protein T265_02602 [Opisthorchis viverrini]KER31037.1 hypothetical protein T265_02602 [Opisthorchis viverrini]
MVKDTGRSGPIAQPVALVHQRIQCATECTAPGRLMFQSGAAHSAAWKHHKREIQLGSSIAQWIAEVRKPSHHGKIQSLRLFK